MRRIVGLIAIAGLSITAAFAYAQQAAAPKHTIKEVMQKAHKGGLLKKVTDGGANDADKKALLDLYVSLRENKAPRGDQEDWHAKTDTILIAAAKVAAGREGAEATLKSAVNCQECHKAHKPAP